MNSKHAKKQRTPERVKINQDETQPKQKNPFKWTTLAVLQFWVISLAAFGFSNGFPSVDNLPAVSEKTESTSVQAYQLEIDSEEVTPETWRTINLEMRKADGSVAKVDLLRPLWWLEDAEAEVGGTIALSMPEMGIDGDAKVLSIGPCKADSRKIDPTNRVVTGKFTHENAIVLDLAFNNNLNNKVGVTPNHPLWSQTRNGWVEAGQLKVGEYVQTKDGIAQLTFRSQRPGRHRVHNLEVHKDHTYYVSNLGILAHNSCAKRPIWSSTKNKTPVQNAYGHWKKHGKEFPQYNNAKEYVEGAIDFVNNPPQNTLIKKRNNGDTVLFDPATDTFAVQGANGAPKTMFKPDPLKHGHPTNLDYFNAQ